MVTRVLIADDDPVVRRAVRDLIDADDDLECVGAVVDAARAIALAAELRPDVVLLDVRMPGGGPVAARGVRAASPTSAMVAFSAHDDIASRERMLEAGVSTYLVKGVRGRDLIAALKAAGR